MQALRMQTELIATAFASQRGTVFLWCPVFMALGIAVYFSLAFEPPLFYGLSLVSGFISLLYIFRDYPYLRIFLLFILMACIGFASASIRTSIVYTPILQREMQLVNVRGTIEQLENLDTDRHIRAILKDVEIERLKLHQTPRKIRLKLMGRQDLKIGQRIEVLAGLNPPAPPNIPGGFDFQRHSYFLGLGALGFAYKDAVIVAKHTPSNISQFIEGLRRNISGRINAGMQEREASITNALTTGPRAAISKEDNEAIRDSGLAHMLSISGLHITLVFGTVFFFVRALLALVPALALNVPIKKYAALVGMLVAIFYTLISGMSVPTQRSILMCGLIFLAIMVDRTPFSMRTIAFAALVVLLIFPDSLLGASFQMSFAAVAALIGFYEAMRPVLQRWNSKAGVLRKALLFVLGICMTSVIATFITAPYTLYHFQQIPIYSVLGNVLAVPVLSFIVMPTSILALFLMPLGLENLVLWVIEIGVDMILDIAHFVAGLEHAVFRTSQWSALALYSFTFAFIILLIAQGSARWIALVPLAVFFISIAQPIKPDILLSQEGKLIVVRLEQGRYGASTMRAERFVRENWARTLGVSGSDFERWPKEGALQNLICDPAACRWQQDSYKVSFVRKDFAYPEECSWADLVIAPEVKSVQCSAPHSINADNLKTGGAHSVFVSNGGLEILNVQSLRGARPWNAAYQNVRQIIK